MIRLSFDITNIVNIILDNIGKISSNNNDNNNNDNNNNNNSGAVSNKMRESINSDDRKHDCMIFLLMLWRVW